MLPPVHANGRLLWTRRLRSSPSSTETPRYDPTWAETVSHANDHRQVGQPRAREVKHMALGPATRDLLMPMHVAYRYRPRIACRKSLQLTLAEARSQLQFQLDYSQRSTFEIQPP